MKVYTLVYSTDSQLYFHKIEALEESISAVVDKYWGLQSEGYDVAIFEGEPVKVKESIALTLNSGQVITESR